MTNEEHTCQFCYYEYFDGRAYPCSMCVCGEERKDMFMPKGKQNKRKDKPQTIKVGMATDSVTGKVLGVTLDTDCAWNNG